jgi:hypothetical protein
MPGSDVVTHDVKDIIKGLRTASPVNLHRYAEQAAEMLERLTTLHKCINPPPQGRYKSEMRLLLEKLMPQYSVFIAADSYTVQRCIERIRRGTPSAKYNVRKVTGGVNVYRRA